MKKNKNNKDLIIVNVQKSFFKSFNNKYLDELNKFCSKFSRVYQIYDNTNGGNMDYLFPNQVLSFQKSYNEELILSDIQYYFTPEVCQQIEKEWDNKKTGWYKKLKNGDIWLFINSNEHKWFYVNSDLVNFCERLGKTNREITLVGGADNASLYDIEILFNTFNIKYKKDSLFIYSINGCRFKESVKESIKYIFEKSMLQHAQDELKTSKMLDDDEYNNNISKCVIDLISLFSSQGHSGFSASFTKEIFDLLTSFKTLSPITSDPNEWQNDKELGGDGDLWQNLRDPSVFSKDGGKTWKCIDEKKIYQILKESIYVFDYDTDDTDDTMKDINEAYKGAEFTITEKSLDEDNDRYKISLNIAGKDIGYVIIEKVWGLLDFDEEEYGYLFPDDKYIKIEHLEIYPEHRGYALSNILIDKAIDKTKQLGFNRIYLNACSIGNIIPLHKLIDLYKLHGFEVFNLDSNNAEMYLKID